MNRMLQETQRIEVIQAAIGKEQKQACNEEAARQLYDFTLHAAFPSMYCIRRSNRSSGPEARRETSTRNL